MPLRSIPAHAAVRVRRVVARRRWARWLPVSAAGIVLIASVHGYASDVDERRRAWGESRPVWVAVDDVGAGEPIVAEPIDLPLVALSDAAVAADERIVGRLARRSIAMGEVVTRDDVGGTTGLANMPDGSLAVAVSESTPSGSQVGDLVAVVSDGAVLTEDGVVVELLDGAVVVAVPADVAALVALANESGIALLRTGLVADRS